jgi:hypothetical protein
MFLPEELLEAEIVDYLFTVNYGLRIEQGRGFPNKY